MRIWSLDPRVLDRVGLVACWRETLLAQAVLAGRTRGYTQHPQLERFREAPDPLAAVGAYLTGLADEADARGYRFDRARIDRPGPTGAGTSGAGTSGGDTDRPVPRLTVTTGQLALERAHLAAKLALRAPDDLARLGAHARAHPLFDVVDGPVASWERAPMPEDART
ncbi:pyrimidine dimer DNA glycosylase/endonuclease V [Sanguibacter sp. HDW7]|uniref:pyrimidine dimer DNA glycosylase/endonuclease V n=1 Tax=Sanguibacter sp. HDW7 TaxID=2714931 RepID=UPI00140747AD|nr:pyrimidine dimer DNA glycosylase/endonuclease V [Sanguibacter sp. HDW7]QIK84231.1 pyrimidine dimer DNA glycosylase [Sanguibacter sp. HDW7]